MTAIPSLSQSPSFSKSSMRQIKCLLCDRKFSSRTSLFEHIKKEHVGKLSRESYEYLIELGIPRDEILQFCERNSIKIEK